MPPACEQDPGGVRRQVRHNSRMRSVTHREVTTLTGQRASLPLDRTLSAERHPHFSLVARAISALADAVRPWSLPALAATLGVSESHLQRTFTEWAGVSPKRFAQFVSKERALAALRIADDVLDATLAAGISSPGRMHDLLVHCEAITPGQARTRGRDLEIRYGVADTWFGVAFAGITERGICHLRFIDGGDAQAALADLERAWPYARLVADAAGTHDALAVLRQPGVAPARPIRLWLRGTNFQIKVWEALLRIPEGRLLSYAEVARSAGMGSAVRAVASAVAANSVALLVPCHRVIRSSGVLGQYRWGAERKAALIGWEAARRDLRGARAA
jgi:AraC family transcriptional regulator, regulatory protein of adaptative response / methylated-DNA-[protein]-cysteine methyltransferase